MPSSTAKGAPYPIGTDPAASLDTIVQSLAAWVDTQPGVASMTTTQRDALAAPQKWVGRVIFNSTLLRLQIYDGSTWDQPLMAFPKVQTADIQDASVTFAKRQPSGCSYRSTAQTFVGTGSGERFTLGTEERDTDSYGVAGGNQIIIPASGIYAVSSTVQVSSGNTGAISGARIIHFWSDANAISFGSFGGEVYASASAVCYLVAGTAVWVQITVASSFTVAFANTPGVLTVERLA